MSIKVNGVELTEVIYTGVNLDTVKVKKGTAEAVIVFDKMPQLATPQNVTADGTNVSWDEVENATSYDVLADGTSIGTVTPTPAVSKNWKFNGNNASLPVPPATVVVSISGKSYNESTFVEDFTTIDADEDWTYIRFGSGGYWYTPENAWGVANILKFDDEPSGDLLAFLKAHAEAID